VSGATIVRVFGGILDSMEEGGKEVFCKSILYTSEGLQAQVNEYKEKKWWGACKKRTDALRHLEKIREECSNFDELK